MLPQNWFSVLMYSWMQEKNWINIIAAGFRKGRLFPVHFAFSKVKIKRLVFYIATFLEYTNEQNQQMYPGNSLTTAAKTTQLPQMGRDVQVSPNSTLTTTITMKWSEPDKKS